MKKLVPLFSLLVFASLVSLRSTAQPEPVDFKTVDNYFLKNDVRLAAGFNCMVLINAAQFNKAFAPEKTATNAVSLPDFTTQRVIAIALPPSMRKTTLIIDKIEMSGSIAYVHFREVLAENLTYKMTPLTIATFDRASFIKTVAFYKDKHLIKSFPVK